MGGNAGIGSREQGPGVLAAFVPRGTVLLGVVLENKNKHSGTLIVTGARVVEPRGTLIHRIGTRFHPWNPPICKSRGCPAYGFEMSGRAHHPRPFIMRRGKAMGIELDFRISTCADIGSANRSPISLLRVTFHRPHGQTQHRIVRLGEAAIYLRMPRPGDCEQPRGSLP